MMRILALVLLVGNVTPFPLQHLGILNKVSNPSKWVGPSGHGFDMGGRILSLYSSALTPALLKYLISIGRNPDPVVNMGKLVKRRYGERCMDEGNGGVFADSTENDDDPPRLLRFGKRGGGAEASSIECD